MRTGVGLYAFFFGGDYNIMIQVHNMTIKQIRGLLEVGTIDPDMEKCLLEDTRQGVRRLMEQYAKKLERQHLLKEQWERMTIHEKHLQTQGYRLIAGMDEVGRGPLAGPVVAAAVILPHDFYLPGLNDSKKVPPAMRESFYEVITSQAVAYSVAFAGSELIDEINIYRATQKVMRECIDKLSIKPSICLVDGRKMTELGVEQLALVGGDGLSISIAAASIVAKVTRDRWMSEAAREYPEYGFEQHAGYGTPDHLKAIAEYGPSPLHRKSFAGVKEWIATKS